MNSPATEFRRVRIRPWDCITTAWNLIKDQYWLFLGICLVGLLIGGLVPFGILMGPMMCGIFLCYLGKMRGETITFDRLFKGFDYFVESLVATLILLGISLVMFAPIVIAFVVAAIGGAQTLQHVSSAPLVVVTLLIVFCIASALVAAALAVFFFFTYALIVDRRLGGVQAVKLSARAAKANPGGVLGLVLLTFLATLAGVMCCYVGVFFVSPITLGAQAVAYRRVFPQTEPPPVSENCLRGT
jgi:uncharacterized membrane protein